VALSFWKIRRLTLAGAQQCPQRGDDARDSTSSAAFLSQLL